jgi:hypothetical protein
MSDISIPLTPDQWEKLIGWVSEHSEIWIAMMRAAAIRKSSPRHPVHCRLECSEAGAEALLALAKRFCPPAIEAIETALQEWKQGRT